MLALLGSRITLIWLLLVAATGISWRMGQSSSSCARSASVAIMVIAFVKVRFVMLEFMELRHAPAGMRFSAEAGVFAICTTLIVLFLRAPV